MACVAARSSPTESTLRVAAATASRTAATPALGAPPACCCAWHGKAGLIRRMSDIGVQSMFDEQRRVTLMQRGRGLLTAAAQGASLAVDVSVTLTVMCRACPAASAR